DKAKNIINLAMTKMPVDYFGYYTLLEPFAAGYYEVGEKPKAQALLEKLVVKYRENLDYYKTFKPSQQNNIAIEIVTDIERYRGLLHVMKDRGDTEFYNQHKSTFNSYVKIFGRFEREIE